MAVVIWEAECWNWLNKRHLSAVNNGKSSMHSSFCAQLNMSKGDILLSSLVMEDMSLCWHVHMTVLWSKILCDDERIFYFYVAGGWGMLFLKNIHSRWKQTCSVQTVDYIFPKQLVLCHIVDSQNAGWLLKMHLVISLYVDNQKEKHSKIRKKGRLILVHRI